MRVLNLFAPVAVLVAGVLAQTNPASVLAQIPACTQECGVKVLVPAQCPLTDLANCLCTNTTLQSTFALCVVGSCSVADQFKSSTLLQTEICKDAPKESRSAEIIRDVIIISAFSFVIVGLRFYSRALVTSKLWWDDWAIALAAILMIPMTIIPILNATRGFGKHFWDVPPQNLEMLEKILYVVVQALAKFSILFLFLRVFPTRKFRLVVKICIAWMVGHTLAFVMVVAFQCVPVKAVWDHSIHGTCTNSQAFVYSAAGFSIFEDFVIMLLPIWELKDLSLNTKKKLALIFLFALGSFACITSMIRLKYLVAYGTSHDVTHGAVDVILWSVLEDYVAVICASLMCLRPLFVRFLPSVFPTSNNESKNTQSQGWAQARNSKLASKLGVGSKGYELQSEDGEAKEILGQGIRVQKAWTTKSTSAVTNDEESPERSYPQESQRKSEDVWQHASCDTVVLISITSTPFGTGRCSYARIGIAMELNNSSEGLGIRSHRGESVAEHVLANAPYGKACLNCVRSKTRCAVLPSGPKCERCLRLNKDCQPAPTIRKRKVAKRSKPSTASVASKTAALEEKLDDLTLILQRSQAAQTAPSSLPSRSVTSESSSQLENGNFGQPNNLILGENGTGAAAGTKHGPDGRQGVIGLGNYFNYGKLNSKPGGSTRAQDDALCSQYAPPTPSESSSSTSKRTPGIREYFRDSDSAIGCSAPKSNATPPSFPTNSESEVEIAELEETLETYRTKMAPFFPLVIIDKNVTARELMEERPFLSLVIRAICPKSTSRQAELGIEVRRVLGREMLMEGAKNIDLFLGLLVFAAWGHFYLYNKPIISTVIHLATSVAFDLGLTKPVPTEPALIMLAYNAQGCPTMRKDAVRTMEERRSVIGLFLISSVCSCYFQRIEPLRWVPYFEECLQLLEKTREHPTDILLVFLTRLQLIKNAVSRDTSDTLCSEMASPPSEIYFKSLQSQLEELKRNVSPELSGNIIVQLHLHHAVLTLHEHCLGTCSTKPGPPDPSKTLQLAKSLWTCLDATKSWFALFVSADVVPLSSYAEMPMAFMAQMAHFLVALYRLSTFECPGVSWDRQRVRQEVDLGVMINLLTEKWGGVPAAAGIDTTGPGVHNIWMLTNRMLGKIASWWEMKVVAPAAAAAAAAADAESRCGQDLTIGHNAGGNEGLHGFGAQGQLPMQDIDFGAANMDLLDDVWMRDLLAGDFPYQLDF
ncbi:hypothetical protein V502_08683 [Pseudogymnoascus sp. VKM F-4520 (FW-2644)]|nr:hypothetical protein V502_08683 [Pseudogymnoascus sp. VKM F-4520 (FW-2644)]